MFEGGGEMTKLHESAIAPDFTLTDTRGQNVTLSAFQGNRHVVLVLNRGFT